MKLIVSIRGKSPTTLLSSFLKENPNIESVFGFVEFTPLYGGRVFVKPEISEEDVKWLYESGIGLNLPLTNMYPTDKMYESSRALLEKYHRSGNVVTIYDDQLAMLVRRDYPEYMICASAIKNIRTHEGIEKSLGIYDKAVLRTWANVDEEFLKGIKEKDKIILFSSAGQFHNCHSKICFSDISGLNSEWTPTVNIDLDERFSHIRCARELTGSEPPEFQKFDLTKLQELGFNTFKVLRQWHKTRAF